jgi:hypothetical protein
MAAGMQATWSVSAEERAAARAERRARVAAIMSQVKEWRATNPTTNVADATDDVDNGDDDDDDDGGAKVGGCAPSESSSTPCALKN